MIRPDRDREAKPARAKRAKRVSRSGLELPLSSVRRVMQSLCPDFKIKSKAVVFLGGVVEALSREVLAHAGKLTINDLNFTIRKSQLLRALQASNFS